MKIKISFKHLEHTPSLDQKIYEKSEKLNKYFEGKVDMHWVCWTDDKGKHFAEIKLHGPHFDYFASASSDNLYKCFDLVVDKIEKQVEKKKDKMRNRVHTNHDDNPKYQQMIDQEFIEREVNFEEYIKKAV